jgi:hypothetical protein
MPLDHPCRRPGHAARVPSKDDDTKDLIILRRSGEVKEKGKIGTYWANIRYHALCDRGLGDLVYQKCPSHTTRDLRRARLDAASILIIGNSPSLGRILGR